MTPLDKNFRPQEPLLPEVALAFAIVERALRDTQRRFGLPRNRFHTTERNRAFKETKDLWQQDGKDFLDEVKTSLKGHTRWDQLDLAFAIIDVVKDRAQESKRG